MLSFNRKVKSHITEVHLDSKTRVDSCSVICVNYKNVERIIRCSHQ